MGCMLDPLVVCRTLVEIPNGLYRGGYNIALRFMDPRNAMRPAAGRDTATPFYLGVEVKEEEE